MRYLKEYRLIKEGFEKSFEIFEYLLGEVKDQNKNINIVEDIMLDVLDSWGGKMVLGYYIYDNKKQVDIELFYQEYFDYFGMGEDDFDDINRLYYDAIEDINKIRDYLSGDLTLLITYQYASEENGWVGIEITEERKEILSYVEERLKNFGVKMNYNFDTTSSVSNPTKGSNKRLWDLRIEMPIELKIIGEISKLDGVDDSLIKDFESFVKKYKIDSDGVIKLSNIIRKFKR